MPPPPWKYTKPRIALRAAKWLPSLGLQLLANGPRRRPRHLIIAVADHFEPNAWGAGDDEAERRLERWTKQYPRAVADWPDADGRTFRHTYFYPAEQCKPPLVDMVVEHCRAGWGEIEIHLHHGIEAPDTAEATRRTLTEFRDYLAALGCLARWGDDPAPRYAFVHGNWALANSARGRYCGVDEEMQILAETGCYADLTSPSAPNVAQVSKVNCLYECGLPLDRRAPHRRGRNLRVGRPPVIFPIMIQGPLMADFTRRLRGIPVPQIENGELTSERPPNLHRLRYWMNAGIRVQGQPDWAFVKLHCHGMLPRDAGVMYGETLSEFLQRLSSAAREGQFSTHYVSAREMTNIILAACDGREGDPGQFRDYRLLLGARGAVGAPAPTAPPVLGTALDGGAGVSAGA